MHQINIICRTIGKKRTCSLTPYFKHTLLPTRLFLPTITKLAITKLTIIRLFALFALSTLVLPATAHASDDVAQLDKLRTTLQTNLPDIPIDHLSVTRVPGIYEIISEGQVYYVDSTVSFLFDGNLVDLKGRQNLTELSMTAQNLRYIDAIGEENMLIYKSNDAAPTRSMSVFTDLDCPFCQRLHSELDILLDAGVSVRYLLFPREGLNTTAHENLESVWCADDQHAAMTAAKRGELAPVASCDNPITQHFTLAQQLGLTATPMIYLDDGQRINGYLDAHTLLEVLDESEPLKH